MMAHSDANLRMVIENSKYVSLKEWTSVIARVERLSMPVQQRKSASSVDNQPVVTKSWNLPSPEAHWSLNKPMFDHASHGARDLNELSFITDASPDQECTWEFRSCGDWLILSDDVGGRQPCTISCFKVNVHVEKTSKIAQMNDDMEFKARNLLLAGSHSDLVWQKQMRRDPTQVSDRVVTLNGNQMETCGGFYDNDGLSLTSTCIIYASRKFLYTAKHNDLHIIYRQDAIMEFHIMSLENGGQTMRILHLDLETRPVSPSWFGWTSFASTDTHLVASIGGTDIDQLTEDVPGSRCWILPERYGREEIFIWPLDGDGSDITEKDVYMETNKVDPSGRLGTGMNSRTDLWRARDKYVSISRDGRYICVSLEHALVVWDMFDHGRIEGIYHSDLSMCLFSLDLHHLGLGARHVHVLTISDVPQHYKNADHFRINLRTASINDLPWNALWIKYRDILVSPSSTNAAVNTPNETVLASSAVYIPNSKLRQDMDGVDTSKPKDERMASISNAFGRLWMDPDDFELNDSDEDEDGDEDEDEDDDYYDDYIMEEVHYEGFPDEEFDDSEDGSEEGDEDDDIDT